MLICERTIRDAHSGRLSLIGIHDEIPLQRIPSVLPASYFYVKLTNAFGAYKFRLELVRRDDFTTLAEAVVPMFTAHEPLGKPPFH